MTINQPMNTIVTRVISTEDPKAMLPSTINRIPSPKNQPQR